MADDDDSAKLEMLENTTPLHMPYSRPLQNSNDVPHIEDKDIFMNTCDPNPDENIPDMVRQNGVTSNPDENTDFGYNEDINLKQNGVKYYPNSNPDLVYNEDMKIKQNIVTFDPDTNTNQNDCDNIEFHQNGVTYEGNNYAAIGNKEEATKVLKKMKKKHMSDLKGATISFHNLHYTVKVNAPGKKCCSQIDKEIISDVSGIFYNGMNGILGPTGGGKSSLLDILAGRKNKAGLSGTVLIDGEPQPPNFKCKTGYVVQDDVVMGTLSVRENLMFSANLRIKSEVSLEEKKKRVDETILELGLDKCADSKVGTEFIRGVSGGERKRTNIGMELIIRPRVLFLDEPTTGLDASTANAVMTLLHRLSTESRTIVFSIHQPRYSIFKLFDRLMLLGDGKTIYHGPAQETLEYFKEIDYECETYNNPPDFFLDIINGDSTAITSLNLKQTQKNEMNVDAMTENLHQYNKRDKKISVMIDNNTPLTTQLSQLFKRSSWNQKVLDETDPILKLYEAKRSEKLNLLNYLQGDVYSTSFFTQLFYLSKRCLINLVRNPQATFSQLIVTCFFAIIIGLIFLQLNNMKELPVGLQNRVGVIFFVIMNQIFSNLPAIELFIKERVIFIHENASGFYRVSVYFVAKLFCDLIPMRILPVTVFSIITYFMIGFEYTAHQFFIYYACLFLVCMAASALGFAISASVRIFAVASLLISFSFVIMMVFGGFLANMKQMGSWLNWLQYLSIVRYALNIQLINQLKDLTLYVNGTAQPNVGNAYLVEQGIAYETPWDLGQNFLALILMTVLLMIICYIQLRRIPKYK